MTNIPIQNIYRMICYAWDVLPTSENISVGSEEFENIHNLMSKLLIIGIQNLIKKGFYHEYLYVQRQLYTPKGKIDIQESIKSQSLQNKKLVCTFDEFSKDAVFNQILKSTIKLLIGNPYLNKKYVEQLRQLYKVFLNIKEIKLSHKLFIGLKYQRNNIYYRFLMNICDMVFEGLTAYEGKTGIKFLSFLCDKKMAILYEKFVLNFYKKNLSSCEWKVHSPRIKWNLDSEIEYDAQNILPEMHTDIVLENILKRRQFIIDTKYYAQTLISSNYSELEKVRSGHLYQIYTYLCQSKFQGKKSGILLYPTIERELDIYFPISCNHIEVKTLNLNSEWGLISKRLLSLCKN